VRRNCQLHCRPRTPSTKGKETGKLRQGLSHTDRDRGRYTKAGMGLSHTWALGVQILWLRQDQEHLPCQKIITKTAIRKSQKYKHRHAALCALERILAVLNWGYTHLECRKFLELTKVCKLHRQQDHHINKKNSCESGSGIQDFVICIHDFVISQLLDFARNRTHNCIERCACYRKRTQ
jgi:hypothetical protein